MEQGWARACLAGLRSGVQAPSSRLGAHHRLVGFRAGCWQTYTKRVGHERSACSGDRQLGFDQGIDAAEGNARKI